MTPVERKRKYYAFIVANTALTFDDIREMTDTQIYDVLKEFEVKKG